jgi:hypothetical protein
VYLQILSHDHHAKGYAFPSREVITNLSPGYNVKKKMGSKSGAVIQKSEKSAHLMKPKQKLLASGPHPKATKGSDGNAVNSGKKHEPGSEMKRKKAVRAHYKETYKEQAPVSPKTKKHVKGDNK